MIDIAVDVFKRAASYVARNRFLWTLAFFMALAGGGTQGLSLGLQSPMPRAFTSFSPFGKLGERVAEVVKGDTLNLVIFIAAGVVVGAILIAVSAYAQGSAVRGVADLEFDLETGLRQSLSLGFRAFRRFLVLVFLYLLLTAALAVPSLVYWYKFGKGSEGVIFPCMLSVLLGFLVVAFSILATVIFEYSCRYVVLRSMGIIDAIRAAVALTRRFFRETLLAWLTVLLISLLNTLAAAVVVGTISSPLNSLYKYIYEHHNAPLLALGMLVTVIAWFIVVAASGVFTVTASAVWTVSFLEFESVPCS